MRVIRKEVRSKRGIFLFALAAFGARELRETRSLG